MDWFTSDLHLSHMRIAELRGMSVEDMNSMILESFSCVRRGDRVFILGDLGWTEPIIRELFKMLIEKKHSIVYWIEGNHDTEIFKKIDHKDLHKCQTMLIRGYGNYMPIFVSHYPQLIFNKSYNGAYQLHGHIHKDTIDTPMNEALVFGKRLNVNIELHDYKLWSRDDIEEYMRGMPSNLDFYLYKGTDTQKAKVTSTLNRIKELTIQLYKDLENDNY